MEEVVHGIKTFARRVSRRVGNLGPRLGSTVIPEQMPRCTRRVSKLSKMRLTEQPVRPRKESLSCKRITELIGELSDKKGSLYLPKGSVGRMVADLVMDDQTANPKRFEDWRSDDPPEISYRALGNGLSPDQIKKYADANWALEQAIGDAALDFVHKGGDPLSGEEGPILAFSRQLSRRYLDLYRGLVQHEMSRGIPMIPAKAGRLKAHAFTSEEILAMQPACTKVTGWLKQLGYKATVSLFDPKWRETLLQKPIDHFFPSDFVLRKVAADFNTLPEKERQLVERAVRHMGDQDRMDLNAVASGLSAVAQMVPIENASAEERLIMEIRHRVADASARLPLAPGYLGTNPIDYLNAILEGEPDNPQAEFRQQMRFVYMSGQLANAVMGDEELTDSINGMLAHEKQGWQVDKSFVVAMNERCPSRRDLPPLFRYGSQGSLSSLLRTPRSELERVAYIAEHPNPTLLQMVNNHQLSERERLALFGSDKLSEDDMRNKRLPFIPGAALWRPLGSKEIEVRSKGSDQLKKCVEYAEMTEKLEIPVVAGISGTHDKVTTMAGLVGIGISDDPNKREAELQQAKLASIAWLVPSSHHSVHEILQSSKTFGLEYTAGPGSETQVYPLEQEAFLKRVEMHQAKRGFKLPTHYL